MFDIADATLANRQSAADIREGARGISDLASIKLELRAIIKDCTDKTAAKEIAELIGVEG